MTWPAALLRGCGSAARTAATHGSVAQRPASACWRIVTRTRWCPPTLPLTASRRKRKPRSLTPLHCSPAPLRCPAAPQPPRSRVLPAPSLSPALPASPKGVLALVSDDHGFESLLKLFSQQGWLTVVVSNTPFKEAHVRVAWARVVDL